MLFGIGHPPPTHQLQSTCVGEGSRVPNLQMEFNYLESFKSYGIFSDFVVPVVPMLSPSSPCHPYIIPIAPRRSPCGLHGCGLHCLHPMLSPSSPWLWSPLSPPHVVPVVPMLSPSSPCHPHIVPIAPRRSPCGPHDCGLRCLHPMLSPWSLSSPCHSCHPHII